MTQANLARRRFRAILAGEACVHPASVFDPMSARMAEDIGFEAGMFAGSVASLTVLGAPDGILLTLSEFASQARRICRGCALPLLCDADHGYGNALNVMRTVEELENAGVAALSIEDTQLPIRYGSPEKAELVSIEEGVGKIRAAVEAREDRDLVIVGRTSAASITSAQDAAQRLKAYQDAGADALFAVGVRTRVDLAQIAEHTDLPLILGGHGAELKDTEFLGKHRVRLALQGHHPIAAAVHAIHETYKALRSGVNPADLEHIASAELMGKVKRDSQYKRRLKTYMTDL